MGGKSHRAKSLLLSPPLHPTICRAHPLLSPRGPDQLSSISLSVRERGGKFQGKGLHFELITNNVEDCCKEAKGPIHEHGLDHKHVLQRQPTSPSCSLAYQRCLEGKVELSNPQAHLCLNQG